MSISVRAWIKRFMHTDPDNRIKFENPYGDTRKSDRYIELKRRGGEYDLPEDIKPEDIAFFSLEAWLNERRAQGVYRLHKTEIRVQDHETPMGRNTILRGASDSLGDLVALQELIFAGNILPAICWDGPQITRLSWSQRVRTWLQRNRRTRQTAEPVEAPDTQSEDKAPADPDTE